MAPPLENHAIRPVAARRKARKSRHKRSSNKTGIAEFVQRYHMLAELARALCGLTFGQLMRGDADDAKREIRRLFSSRVSRSVLAQVSRLPRRLKVVTIRVCGTVTQALLDSGVVPNLMSSRLAESISLRPEDTTRSITVADGTWAVLCGIVHGAPVSFGGLTGPLDFLVVEGTPFDVIVGCPALEKLQACLDLDQQHVTITVNGDMVQLGFEYDTSDYRLLHPGTDSEDLTSGEGENVASDQDGETSAEQDDDDEYFVALLDEMLLVSSMQYDVAFHDGCNPPLPRYADSVNVVTLNETPTDSRLVPYPDLRTPCHSVSVDTDDEELQDLPDLIDSDGEEDLPRYCCIHMAHCPSPCVVKKDIQNHSDGFEPSALQGLYTQEAPEAPHEHIYDALVLYVQDSDDPRPSGSFESSSEELDGDVRAATLAAKLDHLPEDVQDTISFTLRDYGIVAWSLDDLRRPDVSVTHSSELTDETPNNNGPRRLPPRHTKVVKEEIDKMLETGIITPSTSAWSFPVVIASEKDGNRAFA